MRRAFLVPALGVLLQGAPDPLALPPTAAGPCRALSPAELPVRTDGDPTRRFVSHRGHEMHWQLGLGGGRRIRLLEDTLKRSWLLVSMASPPLPTTVLPHVVSATIDSAGRITGMRTMLTRDPAELAARQRALARQDTAAMRAAFARDNTPLAAADLGRVRDLAQWMRTACAPQPAPPTDTARGSA